MEGMRTEQDSLGFVETVSDKLWKNSKRRTEMPSFSAQDEYEIRPRKGRDGFDLVSNRLHGGPIWYAGPDAVRKAISYAKYCSHLQSRCAIIRVFDEDGEVTETHGQMTHFKKNSRGARRRS
jgi:hypothetical protein